MGDCLLRQMMDVSLFFFYLAPPLGLLLWPVATASNYGMQNERKKKGGRKEGDTFRKSLASKGRAAYRSRTPTRTTHPEHTTTTATCKVRGEP